MRITVLCLALGFIAGAVPVAAQVVSATPDDTRPFGKYLVQICNLSTKSDGTTLNCTPAAPASAPIPLASGTPQTITLKLTGCGTPSTSTCPQPVYPLPNGATFFVSATSDSGLLVNQTLVSGTTPSVSTIPIETGVQAYKVAALGKIVIRATQPGSAQYAAAPPVELILKVAADPTDSTCKGLFVPPPTASQTPAQVDLTGIIGLIGTPTPFVLSAQGADNIFIYSTRFPFDKEGREAAILATIRARIAELAGQTADSLGVTAAATPFSVELTIPHAAALGDLATRIGGLNYSPFTVQDIGSDGVRITAAKQPDCDTWTAFLSSIRRMEWQVTPEPFDLKLYYLASTDVATAYTTLAGGSASGSSTPGSAAAAPAAAGSAAPAAAASGSAAGNATIAITQPPGSKIRISTDTTPCVVAGLTLSNSSACAPASGSGGGAASGGSAPAAAAATPPKPTPPAMASLGLPGATGAQTPADLLVFSDAYPGDDAQILERKRVLAQLDLPRPEMLINAWVMQNSTSNPAAMGKFTSQVRDLVAGYNEAVEKVVLQGWQFVSRQAQIPGFYNAGYYHYIADRYLADTSAKSAAKTVKDAAQSFLDNSPASLADASRDQYGICPEKQYCLGYTTLFEPLKPRLTDLLLALIAANNSQDVTTVTINHVQGFPHPVASESDCEKATLPGGSTRELRERCKAVRANLGLDRDGASRRRTCAADDYQDILGSMIGDPRKGPQIYLNCLQTAASTYMSAEGIGLLRGAIADFLFNYKMSQQYPHEFAPYDLSQSADALNSALGPIIDAFNRDIIAFQTFMRADMQYQVERLNNDSDQRCCVKRLFGLDKPSFFNDGLVSVRTISGTQTQVSTTSQSALDNSSAPTLSSLLSSIASPTASSGTSPLAAVTGIAQPGAALLNGVASAYQTSSVQIGRQLMLQVTPRSLSTASAAEITVGLNADETSGGPLYSGGPQGSNPNTSRVAQHDTSTRIRVESVKLFELSSFAAIVERSRSRFPLLPPFVEIPYIGTVAGIPIPGAREYHSSTAVISAMVVPTAADIAYGLRFVMDQVVEGDSGSATCSYIPGSAGADVKNGCTFRRAVSLRDLKIPIHNFHKFMISCLGTGMKSPYSSYLSLTTPPLGACDKLTFDTVPRESY